MTVGDQERQERLSQALASGRSCRSSGPLGAAIRAGGGVSWFIGPEGSPTHADDARPGARSGEETPMDRVYGDPVGDRCEFVSSGWDARGAAAAREGSRMTTPRADKQMFHVKRSGSAVRMTSSWVPDPPGA